MLLLLSRFSRVRLSATPETAAHQAPLSLGFSRQEYWSGLPFPSPMHESEKWKWSRSVLSDSERPHGLQPRGSSVHRILQARVLEWGAIAFSGHIDIRVRWFFVVGVVLSIVGCLAASLVFTHWVLVTPLKRGQSKTSSGTTQSPLECKITPGWESLALNAHNPHKSEAFLKMFLSLTHKLNHWPLAAVEKNY